MNEYMKRQTAVEWLHAQVIAHAGVVTMAMIEKAREMEKQRIIDAHEAAYIAMNMSFRAIDRAEEYFEQTYGKNTRSED